MPTTQPERVTFEYEFTPAAVRQQAEASVNWQQLSASMRTIQEQAAAANALVTASGRPPVAEPPPTLTLPELSPACLERITGCCDFPDYEFNFLLKGTWNREFDCDWLVQYTHKNQNRRVFGLWIKDRNADACYLNDLQMEDSMFRKIRARSARDVEQFFKALLDGRKRYLAKELGGDDSPEYQLLLDCVYTDESCLKNLETPKAKLARREKELYREGVAKEGEKIQAFINAKRRDPNYIEMPTGERVDRIRACINRTRRSEDRIYN